LLKAGTDDSPITAITAFNSHLAIMDNAQDPRLLELKRLQLALDAASKHLDEFEARALHAGSVRTKASSENSLAQDVAVGLAKLGRANEN
jgi:hypothetical protein